jgi:hypothetical protein
MNHGIKRDVLSFVGAAFFAGTLAPAATAYAQTLPTSIVRTVSAASFVATGTGSKTYTTSIPVDGLYGFKSNTAVSLYIDLTSNAAGQEYVVNTCRQPWTGSSPTCVSKGGGFNVAGPIDVLLPTTGLNSANNAAYDYYYVSAVVTSGVTPLGIGASMPRQF